MNGKDEKSSTWMLLMADNAAGMVYERAQKWKLVGALEEQR